MQIEAIYHSVAANNLSEKDILEIVEKAQQLNKQKNITGCLLYYNNEFIQALEGEEKDVNELLNKIENDPRHTEMHVIYKGKCEKRSYESWNMAYDALSGIDLKKLESVIDMNGFAALHDIKTSPSRVKKMFTYLSNELKNE